MTVASGRDIDASDWTERDLLTRELAGERLAADAAETLAELTALQTAAAPDADAVAQLQRRLNALRATRANVEAGR
ncbi:MAG: hypothetical protein WBW75_23620 [Mycobacterium sp.]|uniref:hypothetical protein n=1 Tax=Mycobacterium sp. TaxID=1785 RepID=UPI003C485320